MFRQMEKLIELLNEHRREIIKKQSWITERHYNGYVFGLGDLKPQQAELLIISKQYWFIQWLVENEKVEWNNKDIAIKEWILWKSIDNYHSLLMALAIQDNPIEFLVSILK